MISFDFNNLQPNSIPILDSLLCILFGEIAKSVCDVL
jgi:hypothetical protein